MIGVTALALTAVGASVMLRYAKTKNERARCLCSALFPLHHCKQIVVEIRQFLG